jgi:CRISPR-associated protein Cas2
MSASQAAEAPLFAVCYDVANDRERRRLSNLLLGYGFRSQKSVFECRLSAAAQARLTRQIEALGLKTGHVRLYRVYAGTAAVTIGEPPTDPDAVYCYAV